MTNDTSSSPQPLHEKRPIPRGDQKAATLVPSAVAPKNESPPLSSSPRSATKTPTTTAIDHFTS
jgi:hypothetical protein